MNMVHTVKNIKTKLPPLKINIGFWVRQAGKLAVIGLFLHSDVPVATVLGVFLGWKALGFVMRLFGQLLSLFFTLVSIVIVLIIISFIIL
jgi:hypothetical protein